MDFEDDSLPDGKTKRPANRFIAWMLGNEEVLTTLVMAILIISMILLFSGLQIGSSKKRLGRGVRSHSYVISTSTPAARTSTSSTQ